MDREQNRQKVICAENIMKQNKQNKYGPKNIETQETAEIPQHLVVTTQSGQWQGNTEGKMFTGERD